MMLVSVGKLMQRLQTHLSNVQFTNKRSIHKFNDQSNHFDI